MALISTHKWCIQPSAGSNPTAIWNFKDEPDANRVIPIGVSQIIISFKGYNLKFNVARTGYFKNPNIGDDMGTYIEIEYAPYNSTVYIKSITAESYDNLIGKPYGSANPFTASLYSSAPGPSPSHKKNKIVFGGETLLDISTDTVTADKLMRGYTAHDKAGVAITGTYTPLDTSDATAEASNIFVGKTAYVDGHKVTGTMADTEGWSCLVSTYDETDPTIDYIPEGYHDGTGVVEWDTGAVAELLPENIKKDCYILGITGEYEGGGTDVSDTTATAETVLEGYDFYDADGNYTAGTCTYNCDTTNDDILEDAVLSGFTFHNSSGEECVGNITNYGDVSQYITSPSDVIEISDGYHEYSTFSIVSAEADRIIPENIAEGVSILGVEGTLAPGITPSGNISITNTSEYDVTEYATAQVVDAALIAENIKKDVDILGVTGTYEGSGGGKPQFRVGTKSVTLTSNTNMLNFTGLDGCPIAFMIQPSGSPVSGSTSKCCCAAVVGWPGANNANNAFTGIVSYHNDTSNGKVWKHTNSLPAGVNTFTCTRTNNSLSVKYGNNATNYFWYGSAGSHTYTLTYIYSDTITTDNMIRPYCINQLSGSSSDATNSRPDIYIYNAPGGHESSSPYTGYGGIGIAIPAEWVDSTSTDPNAMKAYYIKYSYVSVSSNYSISATNSSTTWTGTGLASHTGSNHGTGYSYMF